MPSLPIITKSVIVQYIFDIVAPCIIVVSLNTKRINQKKNHLHLNAYGNIVSTFTYHKHEFIVDDFKRRICFKNVKINFSFNDDWL